MAVKPNSLPTKMLLYASTFALALGAATMCAVPFVAAAYYFDLGDERPLWVGFIALLLLVGVPMTRQRRSLR
ncbi:MAG: hypothetical protein M3Q76_07835 [Acidobacteriota bacterium]|nr:hypothetical protein [Acidobacteriota bacterium]